MRFKDFLLETPLPDEWNEDIFKSDVPFETKLAYAQQRAKEIGRGSSRVVFEIQYEGRKTVLKIAKNQYGLMQNKNELKTLQDPFNKKLGLFIPLIDGDEQGNWIHTEYADDVSFTDFERELNVSLDTFIWFFIDLHDVLIGKGLMKRIMPHINRINTESDLYKKMEDYVDHNMRNPKLAIADYLGRDNWGRYKGQLVIIDAGFDKDVQTAYEKHQEGLKKQSPLKEYIEKRGSDWVILNHKRTKELGRYPTKKQAVKRLRQIEYFKHLNESQDTSIQSEPVITWYHGRIKDLPELRPGVSGEDVWGSGIYLTTSYSQAFKFATDKTGVGYVYTVQPTVSNTLSCYDTVSSKDIAKMDEAGIIHPKIDESSTVLKLVMVIKDKYGKKQLTPIFQHLGYDSLLTPTTHDTREKQLVVYDSHNAKILSKERVVK